MVDATSGAAALELPALACSTAGGGPGTVAVDRLGVNRWSVSVGRDAHRAREAVRRLDPWLPSHVLEALAPAPAGDLVQLSIELDLCGAWVTVANAGPCRPLAVRRAGWIDLRGHPAPAPGGPHRYADDRVGLGPGDAVVLVPAAHRRAVRGGGPDLSPSDVDDRLIDVVLAVASGAGAPSAHQVHQALDPGVSDGPPVLVLAVPLPAGDDPRAELAAALGVDAGALHLPGYPLGDLQPDLWHHPPAPPRLARLALPRDRAPLRQVRDLLRRLLASWRIAEQVAADDVELLATEVVTNALRHSGTPATVTVRYDGPSVQVSVRDRSPALPRLLPVDPTRLGGRGMHLVDELAAAWGAEPTEDGKRVWFAVPVRPDR